MRIGVRRTGTDSHRGIGGAMKAFMALTYPRHEIVFHPQCFVTEGHFAGPDEYRAAAFLEFATIPRSTRSGSRAGGYGSNRILDMAMPQLGPAARNKTYIGYSDMGSCSARSMPGGSGGRRMDRWRARWAATTRAWMPAGCSAG
ncbi:LD-carboxypeptidase domain-containing protein [Ditylenchus destructor]|uniref:LD-carboxypeptidase domain-containing protein n=1 Tax=Ditylenchus destructor TaxID=166010 RepID=A0AAD4QVE1_9BILA|nr:LD-carboxypeptidase domain-containing protein [Ditylenchus destructor]